MNKFSETAIAVWDWPLKSQFAQSAEDKKSLRSASDFGSVVAGVVIYPPIAMSLKSHGLAFALAGVLVMAGYYGGSTIWKMNRRYRHHRI